MSFNRLKSANNFVLTLSTGVVALQATADGELNATVITEFKVQIGEFANTSPVATVECFLIKKVQGAGNRNFILLGNGHGDLFRHTSGYLFKEFLG